MPDITMCGSIKCPKRQLCERNAESGTIPDEYRQAYFVLPATNMEVEACPSYLSKNKGATR